jgi:hypothetical protein
MAGKKLNVAGIASELQGASVFFPSRSQPLPSSTQVAEKGDDVGTTKNAATPSLVTTRDRSALVEPVISDELPAHPTAPSSVAYMPEKEEEPSKRDNTPVVQEDSKLSSEQASMLASKHDSVLAKVKARVREVGREVSYTRLTTEEKRQIMEVIYSLRSTNNIKTTENELMRVAINFLLEDYCLQKEESILFKILHP